MSPANRLATIDTTILSILFDDPDDPDHSDDPLDRDDSDYPDGSDLLDLE